MATIEQVIETIVSKVIEHDWVSQAEVAREFGTELNGNYVLKTDKKVVLFVGCSELFLDAVNRLLGEAPRRVELAPGSIMSLMIDGCPIPSQMPLAKRLPKEGYKTEHFCPTLFVRPSTYKALP